MGTSLLEIQNLLGAMGQIDRAAPIILGEMVLSGPEVPDQLILGGRQQLVIHSIIGGGRIIDSIGNDPARLVLNGRFVGPSASQRARRIEIMRDAAQPIPFRVVDIAAQVWIAEFSWAYQAQGTICPYRLVLEREDLPPVGSVSAPDGADADYRSSLSVISDMLGAMSDAGWTGTNMVSALAMQVMPIARLLGAGGILAKAQDALNQAGGFWQTGAALAHTPSALQNFSSALSEASVQLLHMRDEMGAALDNEQAITASNFLSMAQATGASVIATDASAYAKHAQMLMEI